MAQLHAGLTRLNMGLSIYSSCHLNTMYNRQHLCKNKVGNQAQNNVDCLENVSFLSVKFFFLDIMVHLGFYLRDV